MFYHTNSINANDELKSVISDISTWLASQLTLGCYSSGRGSQVGGGAKEEEHIGHSHLAGHVRPILAIPDRDGRMHVDGAGTKIHIETVAPDLVLQKSTEALFSSHPINSVNTKKLSHRMFRHMHGVLNEVYLQNFLHRWTVNRETNLMSLLNPWFATVMLQ